MAMVTNNKNLGNVVAQNVAKSNAKARTVKYVVAAAAPAQPEDLFEDPAWQAALEAEVLARHNNGGQPL